MVLVLVPYEYRGEIWVTLAVEIVAALALILTIAIFGLAIRTIVGKTLLKAIDTLFDRIPGLNTVYLATRQVLEFFLARKNRFFTEPVLIEYPSRGIWALAFNTGEAPVTLTGDNSGKYFSVFIPTTPNPTSGFLAVVSAERMRTVDMTVEEAIKLILTGGIVKT
jgi:uncharacterized membrane protein